MARRGRPSKPQQQMILDFTFRNKLLRMLRKGKVDVLPLGTFEIVNIPARTLYHNFSGYQKTFPAYKKLKFTQSLLTKNTL